MAVHLRGYIKGGPELLAALSRLRRELSDQALAQAAEAGGNVIARAWEGNVRTRIGLGPGTAHYAEAIGVKPYPGQQGAVVVIGTNKDVALSRGEDHPSKYAPRLEFGGANRPAKPTLRPAVDSSKGAAVEAVAKTVRGLIEKVV